MAITYSTERKIKLTNIGKRNKYYIAYIVMCLDQYFCANAIFLYLQQVPLVLALLLWLAGRYEGTTKASCTHYLQFLLLQLLCFKLYMYLYSFCLNIIYFNSCNDKQLECLPHNLENLQQALDMLTTYLGSDR